MKEKQEKLKSPKNDPDEQADVAAPTYKVWLEIEEFDEVNEDCTGKTPELPHLLVECSTFGGANGFVKQCVSLTAAAGLAERWGAATAILDEPREFPECNCQAHTVVGYNVDNDQVFVEFVFASSSTEAAIAATKRLTSDTKSTEPDDDEALGHGVRRLTSVITSVPNGAPNNKSTGDPFLVSRLATLRRIHNG